MDKPEIMSIDRWGKYHCVDCGAKCSDFTRPSECFWYLKDSCDDWNNTYIGATFQHNFDIEFYEAKIAEARKELLAEVEKIGDRCAGDCMYEIEGKYCCLYTKDCPPWQQFKGKE